MSTPQKNLVSRIFTLAALFLLVASSSPLLASDAIGTWTLTGPMTTARFYHTATLLPNEFVLVAGGSISYPLTPTESAEIYSPADGIFVSTDSMSVARVGHTATLLPNGKVLVAGGTNGTSEQFSAELYTYGLFGGFSTTGNMGAARAYHTATLLPNGQVLLAGGQKDNVALKVSQLYDPATGQFTATTGPMQAGRYKHTATLLPNGKVLVAGGLNSAGNPIASAEIYNPATGTWGSTDPMAARWPHSATLLRNGKVLIEGGLTTTYPQLYDPVTGTWSNTSSVGGGDIQSMTNLLRDGKVLITAGKSGWLPGFFQLYDPVADSFSETGNMVIARFAPTATRLSDGSVLAMGGLVINEPTIGVAASAEIYHPVPPPQVDLPPLLAFYPFEGSARDASGNGRHGTVIGTPILTTRGYEGQAYRFNVSGVGDYIAVPLNIGPFSYPRLTMGCWALTTAETPNQAVLNQDNGGFDRYLGIDNRGGGTGWSAFSGSGGVLGAVPAIRTAWTFLAVTYDQTAQSVRLQVDDMVFTRTGVNSGEGLNQLVIGASPPFNVFFSGAIDNVFIFGDLLTDQQLAYIRNGGSKAILPARPQKVMPAIELLLMD